MEEKYREFYALRHFPEINKSFKQIDGQKILKQKRPTSNYRPTTPKIAPEQDEIYALKQKLQTLNKSCLGEINDLALVYGNIRQCRYLRQRPHTATGPGQRAVSPVKTTNKHSITIATMTSNLVASPARSYAKTPKSMLDRALRKIALAGVPVSYTDDLDSTALLVLDSLFSILHCRQVGRMAQAIDAKDFQEKLFLTLGVRLSCDETDALLAVRRK